LWGADRLGAPDPPAGLERIDGFLPDGAVSAYGLLAELLPGFALFRYPGKLMVLAVLCGSALAGLGWDRLAREEPGRQAARRWCLISVAVSMGLGLVVVCGRSTIEPWATRHVPPGSLYGPVDAAGAVDQTLRALIQGAVVYALGATLA